jgi:hypothetical protein
VYVLIVISSGIAYMYMLVVISIVSIVLNVSVRAKN